MEKEKNISDLKDDVEYLIIQNEKTGEEIVKITPQTSFVKEPFIIRTKYKPIKKTNRRDISLSGEN